MTGHGLDVKDRGEGSRTLPVSGQSQFLRMRDKPPFSLAQMRCSANTSDLLLGPENVSEVKPRVSEVEHIASFFY